MRRQAVESSNIKSVGYKAREKLLEVRFKSGQTYHYKEVPKEVFENLMGAESKGQFFHKNIRASFDYTKVESKDA